MPLSIYIALSLEHPATLSFSLTRFLSIPLTPPLVQPPFLACSFSPRSYIYLSVSHPLFSLLFLRSSRAPHHRRFARASIEPAKHRPILHLNLVNLPELANELRAWCLILAHEHSRRYTASNASGEGTRVQSYTKFANDRETQPPGTASSGTRCRLRRNKAFYRKLATRLKNGSRIRKVPSRPSNKQSESARRASRVNMKNAKYPDYFDSMEATV